MRQPWFPRCLGLPIALLALSVPSPVQAGQSAPVSPSTQTNELHGTPSLRNYTLKDFGVGNQFWTIAQDHRGIMYFGSGGGVILEYDGITWRKIFVPSEIIRSLAIDDSGKIWVGAGASFGYLEPDSAGSLHFVSLIDKVPVADRDFTSVWQTLVTSQGVFFRTLQHLFRWDGQKMKVWAAQPKANFQALSAVRGHVYTDQEGIGLEEIVGDELRVAPGGDAYKTSLKLFLNPYDDTHILVSERNGLLTLYDGAKSSPFPTQADAYFQQSKLYSSNVLSDGAICVTTLTGGP